VRTFLEKNNALFFPVLVKWELAKEHEKFCSSTGGACEAPKVSSFIHHNTQKKNIPKPNLVTNSKHPLQQVLEMSSPEKKGAKGMCAWMSHEVRIKG